MNRRVNDAQETFLATVNAESFVATRERQQRGLKKRSRKGEDSSDPIVTDDLFKMSQAVIKMSNRINDLEFEIACYKKAISPIAKPLSEEEIKIASVQTSDYNQIAADFYGYHQDQFYLLLEKTDLLANASYNGNEQALKILKLKANARSREILKLKKALNEDTNINDPQTAEEILALGFTGSEYEVFLSDKMDANSNESADDLYLSCMNRASEIMSLANDLKQKLLQNQNSQTSCKNF